MRPGTAAIFGSDASLPELTPAHLSNFSTSSLQARERFTLTLTGSKLPYLHAQKLRTSDMLELPIAIQNMKPLGHLSYDCGC